MRGGGKRREKKRGGVITELGGRDGWNSNSLRVAIQKEERSGYAGKVADYDTPVMIPDLGILATFLLFFNQQLMH